MMAFKTARVPAAVFVSTLLVLLLHGTALAQASTPASFEVTSVKPTPPDRLYNLKFEKCTNGGLFVAHGAPLRWTIEFAFGRPGVQVSGGPDWLSSFDGAYDIEGKPDHSVTDAECRLMVQSLLEDRFSLKVHHEMGEVVAFALVVGKHGPTLQSAKPADAGGGVRINGALQQSLSEHEPADGWSMTELADVVTSFVGHPVVDRTQLAGKYSFSIRFAHTDDSDDPDVRTALQKQLGLKLEPIRTKMEKVVIDHIEKPSPN
jgi:uncharacterized protein (TIGR03435 family)